MAIEGTFTVTELNAVTNEVSGGLYRRCVRRGLRVVAAGFDKDRRARDR